MKHVMAWLLAGTFTLVITPIVYAGQDEEPLSGTPAPAPTAFALPADFDGPAPPVAPAVISRDADGRATIRAVRVTTPLRIDGALSPLPRVMTAIDFSRCRAYHPPPQHFEVLCNRCQALVGVATRLLGRQSSASLSGSPS